MMRAALVIAVLLAVGVAYSQVEPGVPDETQVQQQMLQMPVQKVLDVPLLTLEQEAAVREYLNRYAPNLSRENLAATANGLRLLIGIQQTHVPLTRRPCEIMADYQIITQMLKYLRMYVKVPVAEFFLRPLPVLGEIARADRVSLSGGTCEFEKVSRELCVPAEQVGWFPNDLGMLVPSGPTGAQNSVNIAGMTPDMTPLAWLWLWKQWQNREQPCPPELKVCPPGTPPTPPVPTL